MDGLCTSVPGWARENLIHENLISLAEKHYKPCVAPQPQDSYGRIDSRPPEFARDQVMQTWCPSASGWAHENLIHENLISLTEKQYKPCVAPQPQDSYGKIDSRLAEFARDQVM